MSRALGRTALAAICTSAFVIGCGVRLSVGSDGSGDAAAVGGYSGTGGTAATGGTSGTFVVPLIVAVAPVGCDGVCERVEVVVAGGHPPYTFAWGDGMTGTTREICPPTEVQLVVTDTGTDDAHAGQAFEAKVTSACGNGTGGIPGIPSSDGGTGGAPPVVPSSVCADGVSAPFLAIRSLSSTLSGSPPGPTTRDTDYRVSLNGEPAAAPFLVAHTTLELDLGTCTSLRLAGDAEGKLGMGSDNELVVEYRATSGDGPPKKAWYYGTAANVTYASTGVVLSSPLAPTVNGLFLTPAMYTPGYPALAIDLLHELPAGLRHVALDLYILDGGGFAGTTDVWVIPGR